MCLANDLSLEQFVKEIEKKQEEAKALSQKEDWLLSTLRNESRAAIRTAKTAEEEKFRLEEQVWRDKIKKLKKIPDLEYGDQFNRLVCQRLDLLEANDETIPENKPGLVYAQEIIEVEIKDGIDDQDLVNYLAQKEIDKKQTRTVKAIQRAQTQTDSLKQTLALTTIMLQVRERQVEGAWNTKKLQEVVLSGLRGNPIQLISVICCINEYDGQGGCSVNPNINTYLEKPKAYPIPLLIDELIATRLFLESYGINATIKILVPDTEYTEVEKFGPKKDTILQQVATFTQNVRTYAEKNDPSRKSFVMPISSLVGQMPIYQKVKQEILKQVTSWNDPEFSRRWYQMFERYSEAMSERVTKRKIFPKDQVRTKSLEITRRRWAVNAAEGAVFSNLGENTIIISSESRERDTIYTVSKKTKAKFPPIIYLIKATQRWNQQLAPS